MSTPRTDEAAFVSGPPNDRHDVVTVQFAEQLERELNAANSKLSTVFQWINRNHPDGFIDSLTHLQNLDRVSDLHHERIDQLEAALSGRTVSCSNCNALAKENAAMKKLIRQIYYDTEGYADGAPDATAHDKLCNEISFQLEPYIK